MKYNEKVIYIKKDTLSKIEAFLRRLILKSNQLSPKWSRVLKALLGGISGLLVFIILLYAEEKLQWRNYWIFMVILFVIILVLVS
jgi:hypothetical protein